MMLLVDVDQRFSAVQVLEHPWVNVSDFLLPLHFLLMFLWKTADFLVVSPPFLKCCVCICSSPSSQNSYGISVLFHEDL